MSFRTTRSVFPLAAFAILGMGFSPTVWAQSKPAPAVSPAAADPAKQIEPALKGPEVIDRAHARGKGTGGFGPDSIEKKKAGGKPAPPLGMPAFLKSLDVVRSAPTPEATRLSSEQDSRIKSLAADYENAVKAYMAANQTELDALRAKLTPADRTMLDAQLQRGGSIKLSKTGFGGKSGVLKQRAKQNNAAPATPADAGPGTTAGPSKDEAAKTRSRLVEIYAGRPKVEDVQARIMGVLTPDQLTIVDKQLADREGMDGPRRHAPKGKGKGI